MTLQNFRLYSERLLLRSWRVEDAPWYVTVRDDEIYRWTTENRDLTVEQTEQAILHYQSGEEAFCFAITEAQTGELLGNLALECADASKSVGIGHYWLAPQGRGHGYATEALKRITEWGITEIEFQTIQLHILIDNLRSQQVAQRVGYKRIEGSEKDGWVWYEYKNVE